MFGAVAEVRADVFVFAVQTCKDHDAYNVLDISQWEFYVVPAQPIRASTFKTLSIAWVHRHAQPVPFADLASAIEAAGADASPAPPGGGDGDGGGA